MNRQSYCSVLLFFFSYFKNITAQTTKLQTRSDSSPRSLKYNFLKYIRLLFLIFLLTGCKKLPKKPNIVLILADDMGIGDIQSHYPTSRIPTPVLDKLSFEGMRFSDAHSTSAVCTPSRYSLLTGRYAWRTKLQEWVLDAWDGPLIDQKIQTLPEMLKKEGYQTALFGKWHLGMTWHGQTKEALIQPITDGPNQHGFDYYFGVDVPNFPPFAWIENNQITIAPTESFRQTDISPSMHLNYRRTPAPMATEWKFDEILPELTRRCVSYIHQQSKKGTPFFMMFSLTSPHEPVAPSKDFSGRSSIAPIADFIMETDWSVGEVIRAVEEAGIADNTIIIFTADNGHSHYTGLEYLLAAGHDPSGGLRGHKGDIWEGGHRVPFIIKWPNHVEANSINRQIICLTDIYATLADYLGIELSKTDAVDSFSFLNSLSDPEVKARNQLVHHSRNGEFALREGFWKIVYRMPMANLKDSRGMKCIPELYNLEEDEMETKNIAEQNPLVVNEMTEKLSKIIFEGSSRPGAYSHNDVSVDFGKIQSPRSQRW